MKELIENMIRYAEEETKDFVIIDFVDTLLYIIDYVINTPIEWADIRDELAAEATELDHKSWAYKFLGL